MPCFSPASHAGGNILDDPAVFSASESMPTNASLVLPGAVVETVVRGTGASGGRLVEVHQS